MKRTKIICLLGLLLFLLSTGLSAHQDSGNDLLTWWKAYQRFKNADSIHRPTSNTYYQAGMFDGFVLGALNALRQHDIDFPSSVTYGQIYSIVGKYLEDHPEELHLNAFKLVRSALSVFPPQK